MPDRAWFITVEGLEGAGKTSCLGTIERFFRARGADPVLTREPGGTPLGEAIRGLLLDVGHAGMSADAETLLMFAARAEHLAKVIRPALATGRPVICDRFTDATYAYQGGGRGLGGERIGPLEQWTQQGLEPDLTIYLDVPVQLGLERAGRRSTPDRFERERLHFFERVRAAYQERAQRSGDRFATIDATAPPHAVQAQIAAMLESKLNASA